LKQAAAPKVWSRLTRLLHWGLALCILINFINDGDGFKDAHRIVGYIATAIVVTRLIYGFLGSTHTFKHHVFWHWPLHPRQLIRFLRAEVHGKTSEHYEGHNPAAAWTYLAIWVCVMILGVSGFMMGLDAFWGEEWLEELHSLTTDVLLVLLLVHLVGLIKDAVKHKRQSWKRMISGGY
jgi:cytochrome b